jgi:uncharacterized protein YndB with AHSA1/START domain
MSTLFIIISFLAISIALLLLLALFIKPSYAIVREIIIDAPRKEVFDYIRLVKNQEKYSHWVMQDPTNKITYKGVDGTVGFLSAWEGKKGAGKGEQEMVAIEEGMHIHMELRFEKPFKNVAHTYFTTIDTSDAKTLVKWQMVGKNKFPMTLFNLFIDNFLGKDMDKSLANLKHILESRA